MSFPIRCFSCAKVIGRYEVPYTRLRSQLMKDGLTENEATREAMDRLQIDSVCCRRIFMTHVDHWSKMMENPRGPGPTLHRTENPDCLQNPGSSLSV